MDTRYHIYFYIFENYLNNSSQIGYGTRDNTKWGDFPILKVGICRNDLDRIEENTKREVKDRFVNIWGKITLYGKVVVDTKKLARDYEKKLLEAFGEKDFWIKEKPTGITEMRVWTTQREQIVDFFIKEFG